MASGATSGEVGQQNVLPLLPGLATQFAELVAPFGEAPEVTGERAQLLGIVLSGEVSGRDSLNGLAAKADELAEAADTQWNGWSRRMHVDSTVVGAIGRLLKPGAIDSLAD